MSAELNNAGWQHRLIGPFDGSFLGTPTLIGPWGCPVALPRHQGLTDSSNEACHRRGKGPLQSGQRTSIGPCDVQRVLISHQWRGGKKETPVGDKSPRSAFEYFFVYRMSVLGVGDAQRTHVVGEEGRLWWIFHGRKERGKKKGEEARSPMRLGFDAIIWIADFSPLSSVSLSLCELTITIVVFKQSLLPQWWVLHEKRKTCQVTSASFIV